MILSLGLTSRAEPGDSFPKLSVAIPLRLSGIFFCGKACIPHFLNQRAHCIWRNIRVFLRFLLLLQQLESFTEN
jgi:hypothetical protein